MMHKKRIVWIDILRIIATWGVIVIHGRLYTPFEKGTVQWAENIFIGSLFTCSVPIFLMLSGMLMLKKEQPLKSFLLKKVTKVLLMKIMSILFCGTAGFFWALKNHQILEDAWKNAKYTSSAWAFGESFLAVLFGCYLMTPFLYKIVEDKRIEAYFMVCAVLFCLIFPPFTDLDYIVSAVPSISKIVSWINNSQVFIPVGSTILFVGGHWLDQLCEKISKRLAIILFCSGIIAWEGMSFWLEMHPDTKGLIYALRWGRYYGTYVSPCIIYYSVTVFVFFRVVIGDIDFSEKISKLLTHIGRNCTIIFLIHGSIISTIGSIMPVLWSSSYLVEIFINVSIYFCIGFLISLVLEQIPIIRRITA